MSRWTELQAVVRHRFGLDDVGDGGIEPQTFVDARQTERTAPVTSPSAAPSPTTPCAMPDCEFPAEGICCRTHRVDFAVLLLEDDLLRLGTDWLFWIQEMRPL